MTRPTPQLASTYNSARHEQAGETAIFDSSVSSRVRNLAPGWVARRQAVAAVEISVEKLFTLREIGRRLNLPYFKLQRAARNNLFPTYTLFNARKMARLSEVVAVIEHSRRGGGP